MTVIKPQRGDTNWDGPLNEVIDLVNSFDQNLDAVANLGNSGTSQTIDASANSGYAATLTLNANCSLSLTGATAGALTILELVVTQDATGNRRITWPSTVRWTGAAAPILSTAPGSTDRIRLASYDGTHWLGEMVSRKYAPNGTVLVGWSMPDAPKTVPGVENEILGRWQARSNWTEVAGALYLADTEVPAYVAAHPGRAVDLGIALIPHDIADTGWNAQLDAVIAGTHDADHYSQGQALAALGPATVYARPWWEFNITNPSPITPSKFTGAWQRAIANVRRGFAHDAKPGQVLKIVYCPLVDDRVNQWNEFYPGDDFVDVIASDIYGMIWRDTNPDIQTLIGVIDGRLRSLSAFGRSRGKPVALGEWGNCAPKDNPGTFDIRGCGDCVEYIDLVFDWATNPANNVIYVCYYNSGEAGVGIDLDGAPQSKARFTQRAQAIQQTPPAAVPDRPTMGTATAGYNSAAVTFSPVPTGAPVVDYTATATPGGATATRASSPIKIPGLTAGTTYGFTVHANNVAGHSVESVTSNPVTVLVPIVYAADNFNRSNGSVGSTPTGSQSWAVASGGAGGTWTIDTSRLKGVGGGQHVFVVNTGQSDGTVTVTRVAGNSDDGLAFRVVDQSNWWSLWPSPYDGHYHLLKNLAGSFSDLAVSSVASADGDILSVMLDGSSITCKVNGSVVFTRTDPDLATATRHGVRTIGTGTVLFDNFSHDSVNA